MRTHARGQVKIHTFVHCDSHYNVCCFVDCPILLFHSQKSPWGLKENIHVCRISGVARENATLDATKQLSKSKWSVQILDRTISQLWAGKDFLSRYSNNMCKLLCPNMPKKVMQSSLSFTHLKSLGLIMNAVSGHCNQTQIDILVGLLQICQY